MVLLSHVPIGILGKPCSTAPDLFDGQRENFCIPNLLFGTFSHSLEKQNQAKA